MSAVSGVLLLQRQKKLISRWDSERELYVRRHRTRTTKYNRLVHSATDRRGGYVWNACLPNSVK